ncbi:glucose-1-phosphate cytidylyltransferase, partial [Streptomyces sp. NPDC059835]
ITPVSDLPLWENGGYFVLRQEVFDHIPENGDLVADGCTQLAKRGRLVAHQHRGFRTPPPHPGGKRQEPCPLRLRRGDRAPWVLLSNPRELAQATRPG